MNKKQLQESIMAGVKRAFKENKALNEGFSAWREQNVPRIDYEVFNKCIDNISELFNNLKNMKQIKGIKITYHENASGSWKTFCDCIFAENQSSQVIKDSIMQALSLFKKYINDDEDRFVASINELYIKIMIPKGNHLYKYIQSTLIPGSNKIKDMPYFDLVKWDDATIGLRFSFKALLDNCAEILEYFS